MTVCDFRIEVKETNETRYIYVYNKKTEELLDFFEVDIDKDINDINVVGELVDTLVYDMLVYFMVDIEDTERLEHDIKEYLEYWPLTTVQSTNVCIDTDEYVE